MDEQEQKAGTVKSVIKAISIIEKLSERGAMSLGELSRELRMDKATAYRLLNTFKEAGYVIQNSDTKKYAGSLKLFAIGQRILGQGDLSEVARQHMKELAGETGETVSLGIEMDSDIVYIDRIQSQSAIKVGVSLGTKVPQYCTGMGKAVLAFKRIAQQREILSNLTFYEYTKGTVTDANVLKAQLEQIKRQGYAKDEEEYVLGLTCLAAPIFDHSGEPFAALSISFLTLHFNKADEQRYADMIIEKANRISAELGYHGDYT